MFARLFVSETNFQFFFISRSFVGTYDRFYLELPELLNAERILKVLDLVEQNLKLIEEEIKEALRKNQAYVQTIMSMPG
ncbi:hypothetical protein AYB34_13955 [Leptospira sp. ZV016]|nr:hypothetical protein LEP1GSC166_1833 [Leptospira kirschneri]KXZ27637.1 hypothetical protein AYB32_13580 [Leptospira kirschneri]KXZ32272.1 hypothetical protein AYB34_13955 [Leptospira sp. ZV016]